MNLKFVCGECPITNSLSITSETLKESPLARRVSILIWVAVAILCIGLYLVSISADYNLMIPACEGADGVYELYTGCGAYAITPAEEAILNSWGFTLQQFAVYLLGVFFISAMTYLVLGFLILWRQAGTVIGLTVSLALVIMPLAIYGSGTIWEDVHPALETPGMIAVMLSNIIQTIFILVIPNGRFSPRWAKHLVVPGIILQAFTILHINSILILPDILINLVVLLSVALVIMGISFQVYRYRRDSTQEERQQTKWIAIGIAAYFSSIILWVLVYGGVISVPEGGARLLTMIAFVPIIAIMLMALPTALTMAILRYNLWGIDVAINRSLVGLIVTFVLAIVFLAGIFLVQTVLDASNPVIGLAVSAIGPVLLFNPTRKRVRHFIDRRLYGFAFDLDELQQAQQSKEITNPGELSGKQLGDYTVLDVIGKGGMGEVYKGQGKGQIVAIKTMLPEVASNDTMRTRFMREVAIGKTLDHPGIASVYEGGIRDEMPYLVMEYIEGTDISKQLKSGKTFDTETAVTIMKQVCDALDVAHQHGYVHRDIKPANVMLRENGAAVLMDFGVTKVDDASVALTGTGAIGTISYMAPEQILAAKDVQPYADIYALGVMLYEMLTGERPFKGGAAQVMFAHLQKPAPDPRTLDDSIPDHIADAILCALEKEPSDRFDSAGAFATALRG